MDKVLNVTRVRRRPRSCVDYKHHGAKIHLVARLSTDEPPFWLLSRTDYVKHDSGAPAAITWRLHSSLPGDLFAAFAAAVTEIGG